MLKTVVLALNSLEPKTWTTHEVENVLEFLKNQFVEWPETARIYNGNVSVATDITPRNEQGIEALKKAEGPFYVIVYPAAPAAYAIYYVIAALVIAVTVLATQKIPTSASRNIQDQSSNNELSGRANKPRLNGRIPDIFGTVRSTPDLIALPYTIYENNVEVEYAYMCIGRGAYEVSDVKDDTTFISSISGSSIEVYAPFTSPNSGTPQLTIGNAIATPVLNVTRTNAVNGQVLRSPNDKTIVGQGDIRFVGPTDIELNPLSELDFTKEFEVGDILTISNASLNSSYITDQKTIIADSTGFFKFEIPSSTLPPEFSAGKELIISAALFNNSDLDGFLITTFDVSGTYEIQSVSHTLEGGQDYCNVYLVNPETINPQWLNAINTVETTVVLKVADGTELFDLDGEYEIIGVEAHAITLLDPVLVQPDWGTIGTTEYISPTLTAAGDKWVGPFILTPSTLQEIYCNFVASNGLYKDDGKNQIAFDIEIEIEATPVNSSNTPIGAPELFTTTVLGSSKFKNTRAQTLKAEPTFTGRCSVRARRVTLSDKEFKGQIIDEVKWKDLYAVSPVSQLNFGNVTTVQSVTHATTGALSVKERKLNMLVTRKIPLRISGNSFTTELHATNRADEIFSAICKDPYIGNRTNNEIDFNSIYDAIAEVREYFGTDKAGEFCYTFDSDNLSFEETARMISNAVFCTAYRRGNVIKINFEKETEDSTLLFNHRNKLPQSESRTVRFGNQDQFDGVSFQYVDPLDDALVTYYIPEDRSAVNPKEVESVGIRSGVQAYFQAWRTWNKIRYQNTLVEFDATQEADLLALNDRILVADNTRVETQDGEIDSQSGLELTLSVNVQLSTSFNYTIFLQYSDGSTEGIAVQRGNDVNKVVLTSPPRLPLSTNDDFYAKTTFILVPNQNNGQNAFLVAEKSPLGNMTSKVTAVNYDDRYYNNDKDFINNLVDEHGNNI